MMLDDHRRIIAVVRALGVGEVSSYGDIASVAGLPGRSRLVGHVLAVADEPELAWWRVVTASGRLVPGLEADQAALLAAEGVTVIGDRVRAAPVGRFSSYARSPGCTPSGAC